MRAIMNNKLSVSRLIVFYSLFLVSILLTDRVCLANDVPSWLSGKPDLSIIKERSALYEWVYRQADKQTNGKASKESLAKKRLINLSNKLALYSEKTNKKEFSANLIYLIIGDEEPMHFKFFITKEELNQLLQK